MRLLRWGSLCDGWSGAAVANVVLYTALRISPFHDTRTVTYYHSFETQTRRSYALLPLNRWGFGRYQGQSCGPKVSITENVTVFGCFEVKVTETQVSR